jgi:hypothetical protein
MLSIRLLWQRSIAASFVAAALVGCGTLAPAGFAASGLSPSREPAVRPRAVDEMIVSNRTNDPVRIQLVRETCMLSAPAAGHAVNINPGGIWRDQIATDSTTGKCDRILGRTEFELLFQSRIGFVLANWKIPENFPHWFVTVICARGLSLVFRHPLDFGVVAGSHNHC